MSIPDENEILRLDDEIVGLQYRIQILEAENTKLRAQRQQAIDLNIMLSHELAEIKAKYNAIQS